MKLMNVIETSSHIDPSKFANKEKTKIVEVFSAAVAGKTLEGFHPDVANKSMARIKELGELSSAGDPKAKAELNEIVRWTVQPKLLDRLELLNVISNYKKIGYNETPIISTYKHDVKSRKQAAQGDVPFGSMEKRDTMIKTETISAGVAINYRELQTGNLVNLAEHIQQVQVDLGNKAVAHAYEEFYKQFKALQGIKYYAETAGLTEAAVNEMIKKVRRFGRVTLLGDYSMVSQLTDFAGFKQDGATDATKRISDAALEEIRRNGIVGVHKGADVAEIQNAYNFTETEGDNYKLYLPEDLLFAIPQGDKVPFHTIRKGELASASGFDVVTGQELTRFDLEIGAHVDEFAVQTVGVIKDTNL